MKTNLPNNNMKAHEPRGNSLITDDFAEGKKKKKKIRVIDTIV